MANRSVIILNSSHIQPGSVGNNRFTYNFMTPQTFQNRQISLNSASLFHSILNITTANNNNLVSYQWPNAAGTGLDQFDIQIVDGFYTADTLNAYFQSIFIARKHFLLNQGSKKIFCLEIQENTSRYAIQVNSYAITAAYLASQTWTIPQGANWSINTVVLCPAFVIRENAFRDLIGFAAGVSPVVPQPAVGVTYSALSSTCPAMSPVDSLIILCNLVANEFTNPPTALQTIHINADFGSVISFQAQSNNFVSIRNGTYNQVTLEVVDQRFRPVPFVDFSSVFQLLIQ